MAADMAVELRKENVASVSLWPGAVMTENVKDFVSNPQDERVIIRLDSKSLFKTTVYYGTTKETTSKNKYRVPKSFFHWRNIVPVSLKFKCFLAPAIDRVGLESLLERPSTSYSHCFTEKCEIHCRLP